MGLTTNSRFPTFQRPTRAIVPTSTFSGLLTDTAADSINPYTSQGPGIGGAGQTYDDVYSPGPTDPNFANVSLLMHFDGTNGQTTTVDSSSNAHTVTTGGSGFVLTDSQVKYGTTSGNFPNGSQYLTVADDGSLTMGSNDFTIEFWVRFPGATNGTVLSKDNSATGVGEYQIIRSGGSILYYASSNGVSNDLSNGNFLGTAIQNTWIHLAISRSGNFVRLFDQGIAQATIDVTESTFWNSSSFPLRINGRNLGTDLGIFFMDDLRITKGVGRYTANFTPPAEPFADQ